MRRSLLLLTAVAMACSPQEPPAMPGSTDGGRSVPQADAGRAGHGGEVEVSAGTVRLELVDGGVAEGLLAAVYDHRSWWWTPDDLLTFALLQPERYAPYPDDGSYLFLSSREIADAGALPPAPQAEAYAFMRDAGLAIGRSPLAGVSLVITGHERYHLEEDGYGDFAWDLVRTDEDGRRFVDAGVLNTDYRVWDQPVYLPSDGYVVEVVRDAPDLPPGKLDTGAVNNLVGVHLGGSYYLYLLHFRQGTIPGSDAGTCAPAVPDVACVDVGQTLPAGTYLGRVGNSGVSLEPHLHLTVLWYDARSGRSWSVPSEFLDVHVGASPRGPSTPKAAVVPRSGEYLSSDPF